MRKKYLHQVRGLSACAGPLLCVFFVGVKRHKKRTFIMVSLFSFYCNQQRRAFCFAHHIGTWMVYQLPIIVIVLSAKALLVDCCFALHALTHWQHFRHVWSTIFFLYVLSVDGGVFSDFYFEIIINDTSYFQSIYVFLCIVHFLNWVDGNCIISMCLRPQIFAPDFAYIFFKYLWVRLLFENEVKLHRI